MGRVAARADSGYMDLFCRNAGVLKENAVGGAEIQLPVHPVLFPVRIREDLRSLLRGKGAPEALRHIFPDLITFPADAGAHHCGQILRTGPEFLSHPPDRMSGDLSDGPAPACVQKRDGSVHRICQIDRQAVRMEGGQRDSPGVGEKTVDVIIGPFPEHAGPAVLFPDHHQVHRVGLVRKHEGLRFHAEGRRRPAVVFPNDLLRLSLPEGKVHLREMPGADTSVPRGEAGPHHPEPVQRGKGEQHDAVPLRDLRHGLCFFSDPAIHFCSSSVIP